MITIDLTLLFAILMTVGVIVLAVREDRKEKEWTRHVNQAIRVTRDPSLPRR